MPEAHAKSVSVVAAVNDHETLRECLADSPDIKSGKLDLRTYEGFSSFGLAANAALSETTSDVVVIAHQDVHLPAGFATNLEAQLRVLEIVDPDWAMIGVIGVDGDQRVWGETWASSKQKVIGVPIQQPVRVSSIDEMLLIVRTDTGLVFDEMLPGFHLYGTDYAYMAAAEGRACYVVPLPVIHHSRALVNLGGGFRTAYKYMQRKWKAELPLNTVLGGVQRTMLRLTKQDLGLRWRNRGRKNRPTSRTGSPREISARIGYDNA